MLHPLRAMLASVVLLFPLVLTAQSTATVTGCEAQPEVSALIRDASLRIRPTDDQPLTVEAILRERQDRLRALLSEHPDDFWIRRAFVLASKSGPVASPALLDEWRKQYEAQPGDAATAYLYAMVLTGKDTPEAIRILTRLTEKAPEFPQPWLQLVTIYGSPHFNDASKRQTYAEGYLYRCPDSLDVISAARQLNRSEKLAAYVRRVREKISGKTDLRSVAIYPSLWAAEFKFAPLPDQAKLRQQVEQDLAFLEKLDRKQVPNLDRVLAEGYKLTGNTQAQQKIAEASKIAGLGMQAFFTDQQEWSKSHPYPTSGDAKARDAFFQQRLAWLDQWIAKLPNEEFLHIDRLRTLAMIPSTANEILLAEGENVLAGARRKTGGVAIGSPAQLQVAEVWSSHGLALDRVPSLVEEGLAASRKLAERANQFNESDLYRRPEQDLAQWNNDWQQNLIAWRTLTTVYLKTKNFPEAHKILAKWEEGIEERRKQAQTLQQKRTEEDKGGTKPDGALPARQRPMEDALIRSLPYIEAEFNHQRAELAVAESRKLDALTYYQAELRARASGMPGGISDPVRYAMASPAHTLWRELGGTDEGWQAWAATLRGASTIAVPPPRVGAAQWSAVNRQVPEFSLSDQHGATWTRAKIQGKTTLVNVWATWCGPCVQELPHLQKLYEKLKDREDVQIVTLNVDDNTGLIEPFLTKNKYTFPVLVAKPFVDSFTGSIPIPTNWIADREAKLRYEAVGYSGSGDEWLKQTLAQIEKLRGSTQTAVVTEEKPGIP